LLKGVSRGFDEQLLGAITGPRAGHYNGKYGEDGIEANIEVANEWLSFFTTYHKEMSMELFVEAIDAMTFKSNCADYGFDPYIVIIDKKLTKVLQDEDNKDKLDIVMEAIEKAKKY